MTLPLPEAPQVCLVHGSSGAPPALVEQLRRVGVTFELSARLSTALQRPPSRVLLVRIAELELAEREQLAVVREAGLSPTVVALAARLDTRALAWLLRSGLSVNLLTEDEVGGSPDLEVTLRSLISGELFELARHFEQRVELQTFEVRSSREMAAPLAFAHRLAGEAEAFPRLPGLFRAATEELLTNALFNAPTTPHGAPLYRHVARNQEVALEEGAVIEVHFARGGGQLGVSVGDPFGSIDPRPLLERLAECMGQHLREVRTSSGGAGLGLAQVLDSVSALSIELWPGRKTEVTALLRFERRYRDFLRRGKSFNLFLVAPSSAPPKAE